MTKTKTDNRAKEQAAAQVASIVELVTAFQLAQEKGQAEHEGETVTEEDLQTRISEDPLSVEVRSGWHTPGDTDGAKPSEFTILLCTGGPAVRLIGELDEYQQPFNCQVEYQDWFTPWENYSEISEEDRALVLVYCQQFYFIN